MAKNESSDPISSPLDRSEIEKILKSISFRKTYAEYCDKMKIFRSTKYN